MKVAALIFTIFLAAVSVAGQVTALKNDISGAQFSSVEQKAQKVLKTATYRMSRTFEYFGSRNEPADLIERSVSEVIHPDKWRAVDVSKYPGPVKYEYIWNGKDFFKRTNDGEWTKPEHHWTEWRESRDSEHSAVRYRFLGKTDLNGAQANKYEVESLRVANPYAQNEILKFSGIRRATYWYDGTGRILKKVEVNSINDSEETLVETFDYVYDPKDLKIEAPIM